MMIAGEFSKFRTVFIGTQADAALSILSRKEVFNRRIGATLSHYSTHRCCNSSNQLVCITHCPKFEFGQVVDVLFRCSFLLISYSI